MKALGQRASHIDQSWDWAETRRVCLRETSRVLGSQAAAEDAAQEAVLRAWRQRASCRTPDRPAPWLATIARREALRIAGKTADLPLEDDDAGTPAVHDPLERVHGGIDVRRALLTLDLDDRQLVAARYWLDLSQHQCAIQLGLAEGTVKVRLHRLRSRLRGQIEA